MRKAAVFPEPVGAQARTSRFYRNRSIKQHRLQDVVFCQIAQTTYIIPLNIDILIAEGCQKFHNNRNYVHIFLLNVTILLLVNKNMHSITPYTSHFKIVQYLLLSKIEGITSSFIPVA